MVNKNILKKVSLISFCFTITVFNSQQKDSIKKVTLKPNTSKIIKKEAAERFPKTRLLNIEYNQLSPYNYSSNYKETPLPEGKVKNVSQISVSSNVNIIKKKKWSFSTILNYRYINTTADASDIFSDNKNLTRQKEDFHYFSGSASLGYYSKLFGKTMIYSGTATVDASDKDFGRLRGFLTATMVLKATPETKMTVGIIGLVDPNAIVPAFMTFSYEHQFNNGWIFDAIIPKWVYIRKEVSDQGRLSFGTELGGTLFYVYNNDKAYTFSQMDINSGFLYEQTLGNSFILSAKTGVCYSPSSRLMEKDAEFSDYIFDTKPKPSFYFNVGVSFNPFKKSKQ
ncbi:DUF6268 family outer membrane beta-barrel protein [Cloacibacterium sp.]|uniref:DUF6268 family outer membrane beta-barrel protein n=1 Tax=Cloacibacterium sp. TaxID=1913682 RepID=UPI0039E353C7